jgi:hypothetical protein
MELQLVNLVEAKFIVQNLSAAHNGNITPCSQDAEDHPIAQLVDQDRG